MKTYFATFTIKKRIKNEVVAIRFLKALAKTLEVKPVSYHLQLFPTLDGKGGFGITATLNFADSYATLDTWPEFNIATLDIRSCKKFDERKVKKLIKSFFK